MFRCTVATILTLALTIWARGATAQAPPTPAARGEVPIREVVLSNGERRYVAPLTVGAVAIEAGLDTGSTGLRILPGVVGEVDAKDIGGSEDYSYGSGAELRGSKGQAVVSVGGVSGSTTVQLVHSAGCVAAKPRCPASRVALAQYGIQGDGLPGEGFKAILGINMSHTRIDNPFVAIGARRWIVELPRPGEQTPGRIILNPTDAEVAGFTLFSLNPNLSGLGGGRHDAIPGCLLNDMGKAKVCGAVTLDSGAPGIAVRNGGLGTTPWANGTKATFAFYDNAGHLRAAETFVIGQRTHASHLEFSDEPRVSGATIFSGLTVYFAFDVLYDAEHQAVGLKARPQAPGGPAAVALGG